MPIALETIRNALLSLKATGPRGFEGLLSRVLREITGVSFRLSSSGPQRGVDASAAYTTDAVAFEAKRYDKTIPRATLLSKIAELGTHENDTELWIIGATTSVSTQLADDLQRAGARHGITVLVLDWSGEPLPKLATLLAAGHDATIEFLRSQEVENVEVVSGALLDLKRDRHFDVSVDHLRTALNVPATSVSIAKRRSHFWLRETFGNATQSRQRLNQTLAPGADPPNTLARPKLTSSIAAHLQGVPSGKVVAVLGDEGHGKSWLVCNVWASLDDPPLTLFIPAESLAAEVPVEAIHDLLIRGIARQTGNGSVTDKDRRRWHQVFRMWERAAQQGIQIIVVIDGLNQHPIADWGRTIERFNEELKRIGGVLVTTCRSAYFRERVRPRLKAPFIRIEVPEWTDAERDQILHAHGVDETVVSSDVGKVLKNPRILSVALKLLGSSAIESANQLSVGRLLFEHLRTWEQDGPGHNSAREFAKLLQQSASEYLQRLKQNDSDDLKVFELEWSSVSNGSFFTPIDGDLGQYQLKDDGLHLALGLAIVDSARRAERNERNIGERLNTLLEPINSLDLTAKSLFNALNVASVDESCSDSVCAALIEAFLGAQNIDGAMFPPFFGLAKTRTRAFLLAAEARAKHVTQRSVASDWLYLALKNARQDPGCWSQMKRVISVWLRTYSQPSSDAFSQGGASLRSSKDNSHKKQQELQARIESLTDGERQIHDRLKIDDSANPQRLTDLAFALLHGMPLAEFADDLVAWRLAAAIYQNVGDERYLAFTNLIRLSTDWAAARRALISAVQPLSNPSRVGMWTRFAVIDAAGDLSDAPEADNLYKLLTADHHKWPNFRLVEKLCSSDPCDPSSARPENVGKTSEEYAAIDVSQLAQLLSRTQQDHELDRTRAAMARFEPDVGVAKHRALIADVLRRTGFSLRQGVVELREHMMLIEREDAMQFLARVQDGTCGIVDTDLDASNRLLASQYHLLLAFPRLSAEEQLDAMLAKNSTYNFYLELLDSVKAMDIDSLDRRFRSAFNSKNELEQYVILAFCAMVKADLPSALLSSLPEIVTGASSRLRTRALALIAVSNHRPLLEIVSRGGWRAEDVKDEDGQERWHGSMVLIQAARVGLLSPEALLERIHIDAYGIAARICRNGVALGVSKWLHVALQHIGSIPSLPTYTDVELPHRTADELAPRRVRVSYTPPETEDPAESLRRLSESEFTTRQQQELASGSYRTFKQSAEDASSPLVVQSLGLEDVEAIVAANRPLAEQWCRIIVKAPREKLPALHNLGAALAYAISDLDSKLAADLLEAIDGVDPIIHHTFGRERTTLSELAAWRCKNGPIVEKLRFRRLDRAITDDEIASEVLAALSSNRESSLEAYVSAKLATGIPADHARALMVCAYSGVSEFNEATLRGGEELPGFLGRVQKAAIAAYQRHQWACHWFSMMRSAETSSDLWRYTQLFRKVVDARFESTHDISLPGTDLFNLYRSNILAILGVRYERQQGKRRKTLFGASAPPKSFQ
jgi:hypothetical protein